MMVLYQAGEGGTSIAGILGGRAKEEWVDNNGWE